MFSINNLTFSYPDNPVFSQLNWNTGESRIIGLIGRNGAGKTTLFKLIAGYLKSAGGEITLNGDKIRPGDCAFMETMPHFYPMITGREFLDIFKIRQPGFEADRWNEFFKLPLDKTIEHYSTGMQKKLSFLSIIALNKKLLLLDEPFNGLDFDAVQLLRQIIPHISQRGSTILLSSHIPEAMITICDSISMLNKGEIAFTLPKNMFHNLNEAIGSSGTYNIDMLPFQNLEK